MYPRNCLKKTRPEWRYRWNVSRLHIFMNSFLKSTSGGIQLDFWRRLVKTQDRRVRQHLTGKHQSQAFYRHDLQTCHLLLVIVMHCVMLEHWVKNLSVGVIAPTSASIKGASIHMVEHLVHTPTHLSFQKSKIKSAHYIVLWSYFNVWVVFIWFVGFHFYGGLTQQ